MQKFISCYLSLSLSLFHNINNKHTCRILTLSQNWVLQSLNADYIHHYCTYALPFYSTIQLKSRISLQIMFLLNFTSIKSIYQDWKRKTALINTEIDKTTYSHLCVTFHWFVLVKLQCHTDYRSWQFSNWYGCVLDSVTAMKHLGL